MRKGNRNTLNFIAFVLLGFGISGWGYSLDRLIGWVEGLLITIGIGFLFDGIMANRTGNNLHPTEKPVKLIRELIKANKGQVVFDPFMGSGTTMVACKQLERDFIGIEIDESYCKIANDRLLQSPLTTLFVLEDRKVTE